MRELDFVDGHVAGVVDVEGDFAAAVGFAVRLDPCADAGGLATPFVFGAFGFAAVLAAQKDETDDEGADGA
ncbi:MAG TPA: hypothetical protein VF062_25050 [Candidatus Limnocylindrales bacterium]